MSSTWVRTQPTPDGKGYAVVLEFTDDVSASVTPEEAHRYTAAVMAAVARAEYDAAVLRQLTALVDEGSAVQAISDMRQDRIPLDFDMCRPFWVAPGVNQEGKPFLHLMLDDKPFGQWSIGAAKRHAINVLECVAGADLDAAYLRYLKGTVGLPENSALGAIQDLGNHR